MLREQVEKVLGQAAKALAAQGLIPADLAVRPEAAEPKDPTHGDFACSFPLIIAKAAGKPPREIAQAMADWLCENAPDTVDAAEAAGPGFINIRLAPFALRRAVESVISQGEAYGRIQSETPQRINVEFVSVNPNGPITVGSGRGAAFGSALCSVLEAAGHTVHREFYVNDGLNSEQMRLFGLSVKALSRGEELPEGGYKGDYVQDVADRVMRQHPQTEEDAQWWQQVSQELMLARQREDLKAFGVEFDTWFSEQSLHDDGSVARAVAALEASGIADEEPMRTVLKLAKGGKVEEVTQEAQEEGSTLWLRSTKLGDDMDRVLRRRNGRPTYIASDVAYHADKFNRPKNADRLITILGPDHHGYIGRLHAVVAALRFGDVAPQAGEPLSEVEAQLYSSLEERDRCAAALELAQRQLQVVIFQIVRFLKDGQPAAMRKRDGNIYALIDLVREIGQIMSPESDLAEQERIGSDVARFFYLMRSHDTHLDFDVDAATKKSDENPVFYVQYAHARIGSVLRKAEEALGNLEAEPAMYRHPKEQALILKIADLPWEVARAAEDCGVHRLATYAVDLARTFHHFYDSCRVVQPDDIPSSLARLNLCRAAQAALRSVLSLLGVCAPDRM